MILQHSSIYQYIIKEHQGTFPQQGNERGIHGPLESVWGSTQPKSHHSKLIVVRVSLKDCLIPFSLGQIDLVVSNP
jgi:hypothetical protein